MKYKLSFCKRTMALATLLFLSFSLQVSAACIDTTRDGVMSMLHSIGPAGQIIRNAVTTTITESGSYHLMENINGIIIVNADNVVIDLNGFTITPTPNSSVPAVITLTTESETTGVKNVVIKNGSIDATRIITGGTETITGILVESNAQAIVIEDIKIANATQGIFFVGELGKEITCCRVSNCFVTNSDGAFTLLYTNNSVFENCDNCCCVEGGFVLESCKYNKIKKCKSVRVGGTAAAASAVGFKSTAGTDNLFYECMAEGIYKETNSDFGTEATGFLFDGTATLAGETESKIINCLVDSVFAGDTAGIAYGIHLNMVLKDPIAACPFVQENIDYPITDISWSPSGDKIAISTLVGGIGEEYQRIKILQFDCCAWSEIKTLTNANIDHIEWDPTGRYLAMGGDYIAGSGTLNREVKVFDTVYRAEYYGERVWNPASNASVRNPVWSRDGKYIVYTVNNATQEWVVVYRVDNSGLTLVYNNDLNLSISIGNPAISPDEKLLAFVASTRLYVYNWSFLPPFLGAELAGSYYDTNVGSITDVAFSPIGCCCDCSVHDNYSIVVVGEKGTGTGNIQWINIENGSFVAGTVIDFGADVLRVKFAPNGEYFAVLGENGTLGVYRSDPVAGNPTLVYTYSLGYQIDSGGLDWSPSGRYITFGGALTNGIDAPDFAILEVANVPTKCMICNNKVANVFGGLCAIGIEGASCCNGIMKNIVYNACVSYSRSVLDVWFDGLVGIDQNHINLAVPPYGVVPMVPSAVI